jgi:DNA-binding PadR family transcriptional regulator
MYELIILSFLIRDPMHGYLIARIINDMIGPYARFSNGRLYPLLAKLEEEGLIVAYTEPRDTHKGERQLHSYQITDEGRKRFHDLMMDTTSNPGDYQRLFLHKVPFLEFLKPSERLYLIDHYVNFCQAHVLHLTAEEEDLARTNYLNPSQFDATLNVMQHMIDQWQLELDWAKSLHEKELARRESNASGVLNLEQSNKSLIQNEDNYRPEGD